MLSHGRMLDLQQDLMHTARQLDDLCRGLDGHARFLRHSVHRSDANAMKGKAQVLRGCASHLRDIAQSIAG